uniref:Uncharacterized protein n=1 Tax=Romanomermis culicivorax TaxID=13658 RepID=A0A915HLI2_ROMCU
MAVRRALSFDQILLPQPTNIMQSSAVPTAPAATHALVTNHRSSLAMANANEVHNFQIKARNALEQLSTTTARITNNVPTVQTIDQIIGAVSDQFQAQQLRVQHEIQEEEEASHSAPQRRPQPAANPFGFSDYQPDDYYDHPQPWYKLQCTSHREEDSRIKTIVDNMHLLTIDGAPTNKGLLRFSSCLDNNICLDKI